MEVVFGEQAQDQVGSINSHNGVLTISSSTVWFSFRPIDTCHEWPPCHKKTTLFDIADVLLGRHRPYQLLFKCWHIEISLLLLIFLYFIDPRGHALVLFKLLYKYSIHPLGYLLWEVEKKVFKNYTKVFAITFRTRNKLSIRSSS